MRHTAAQKERRKSNAVAKTVTALSHGGYAVAEGPLPQEQRSNNIVTAL
jgi:hypothetical protein